MEEPNLLKMRQQYIFCLWAICMIPVVGVAQKRQELRPERNTQHLTADDVAKEKEEARKRFLLVTIPSVINGSSIDPAPISSASIDFGEEKLTFKVGFPRPFEAKTTQNDVGPWTASLAPYVASKNKKATLWNKNGWVTTVGLDAALNYVFPSVLWEATGKGEKAYNEWLQTKKGQPHFKYLASVDSTVDDTIKTGDVVSEGMFWLSLRGNLDRTEYSLFDTTAVFADLGYKKPLGLAKGYLSVNWAFHSKLKKHRWKNTLWSSGLGYGSYTNYTDLAERTLQVGSPVFNADSSSMAVVAETTEGRIGPVIVSTGSLFYFEVYKSIAFLPHDGAVRVGVRYDDFGRVGDNFNSRLSGGFFVNAKKRTKKDNEAQEMLNVALTLVCDRFNKNGESDYWNKNVSFVLGVALPLRFI